MKTESLNENSGKKKHRRIEKGEVQNGIAEQSRPSAAFAARHQRMLPVAARTALTKSSVRTATVAMLAMASAAPSGQFPTLSNWTSMMFAIMTPLEPPTSDGVA